MLKIPVEFEFSSPLVERTLLINNSIAEARITVVQNGKIQAAVSASPGSQEIVLPNLSANDRDFQLTLTIKFRANGQKVDVTAIANVGHPESIKLVQSSETYMIGTIKRLTQTHAPIPQALGAAAIASDCDISCVPPSTETRAPGHCVLCDCGSGQFELCC